MTLGWADFAPLAIDLALVAAILIVLIGDLAGGPRAGRGIGYLCGILLLGLFAGSFFLDLSGPSMGGTYVGDAWSTFFKRLFLAAGALAIFGSADHVARHTPTRQSEYHLLILFSVLGMSLLPGARDLLLLVVAFELMGLPLFVLAAWAKTDDPRGVGRHAPEAALKLYLVGAASTAITLFGLSLIVGLSGTTNIDAWIRTAPSPLWFAGGFLVLAGMGFKIGAVPFHFWVPDTYQGSSTPFVAFLSVAPKLAGFAALIAIIHRGLGAGLLHRPTLVTLAVASILLGNLLAVAQTDVKRLLAFSGIGHIGFMLLAFLPGTTESIQMLLFYGGAYVVTNIGAFLIVEQVEDAAGGSSIDDFAGLVYRSPSLATAMLLFLLSLAGIPFVVGFWAKLYVFLAAWEAGLQWIVVLGAIVSVVGLFYYLQIARAMFMRKPAAEAPPLGSSLGMTFAISLCLAAVVVLGAFPAPLLGEAEAAAKAFVAKPTGAR
ncbi:MAG: NADH-quinone oxidoreductase subunit N [Polyangiaceae bacterium]|nr:NADH-quinone oxidoreductase subunit N [Polyangiaceae bacterium]